MKQIISESAINKIIKNAIKKVLNEGESYGWVVEEEDAREAYDFACDALGKETVDDALVGCLSTTQLSDFLAFLFRNWDFRDWEEYKNGEETEL